MKLRQLLFDRGIRQVAIIREVMAGGERLDNSHLSLIVNGFRKPSPKTVRRLRQTLKKLGVPARILNEVEELGGGPGNED